MRITWRAWGEMQKWIWLFTNCSYTWEIIILLAPPFRINIKLRSKSRSANTPYLKRPKVVKKKKRIQMKWASPKTFCHPVCYGSHCLLEKHASSKLLSVWKRFFPSLQFHFPSPFVFVLFMGQGWEWVAEALLSICFISFMNLNWICFFVSLV